MAVQIPTLRRMDPVESPTAGRVSTETANTTAPQQAIDRGVLGVAETAYKYLDEQETNAAALIGTKAGLDYGVKYKTELRKLKTLKGDPTEAYSKLDVDSQTWEKDILSQYEGASPRTRRAVQERIQKTKWELADDRQTSQALQYAAYDKETTDSSVAMKKENALTSIETLDASTPEKFNQTSVPLQLQINGIRDDRIAKGKRDGLVTYDDEGNEKYSPQLLEEIRKDESEVYENSIKTLNAVGKVDEAKALLEQFGDKILAKKRVELLKDNKESGIQNEALVMASKFQNLPPDVALAKVNALPGNSARDLAIKEKAMGNLESFFKRMDQAKELRSKQSLEKLADYVDKSKFLTLNELENDEVFKRLKPTLTSKDQAAIEQMVEAPKSSDNTVKAKAYDALFDGKFVGMSYGEMRQQTAGLSKSDASMFEKAWKDANDETRTEVRQATTYMGSQLRAQMLEAGLIKKNEYGRYVDKEEQKFVRASNRLLELINTLPKNTSMADQNKFVQNFVQTELKNGVYEPPANMNIKLQSSVPTPQVKAPAAPVSITHEQQAQFFADFARRTGRVWKSSNPDDLKAYNAFKASGGKQ